METSLTDASVDEHGIDGDAILYTSGCYMKERGKAMRGTRCHQHYVQLRPLQVSTQPESNNMKSTAVGDSTYMKIWKLTAVLARRGEQTGHIIFRNMPPDGI